MKTKTIYISDDGKEFKTYDECIKHEQELMEKKIKGNITFFDCEFEEFDEGYNLFHKCEFCHGIIIKADIKHKLNEYADFIYGETGFALPREPGYWVYNSETDKWVSLNKKIKELSHWTKIAEKMGGFEGGACV